MALTHPEYLVPPVRTRANECASWPSVNVAVTSHQLSEQKKKTKHVSIRFYLFDWKVKSVQIHQCLV